MTTIRLAKNADLRTVFKIVRKTVSKIYPKYYARGVVTFFLRHHNRESVSEDIEGGRV